MAVIMGLAVVFPPGAPNNLAVAVVAAVIGIAGVHV